MRRPVFAALALFLQTLAASPAAFAQSGAPAADIHGASDHPLVGRFAGSVIDYDQRVEFDEIRLVDQVAFRSWPPNPPEFTLPLEGRIAWLRHVGPPGRSTLEVARNHQQALQAEGFEIAFHCRSAQECTGQAGRSDLMLRMVDHAFAGVPWNQMNTDAMTLNYTLYQRRDAEGVAHIALSTVHMRFPGEDQPRPVTAVVVVEGAPMQTGLIEAPRLIEAGEFDDAFAQDGRVAIYGITFDFDSASLRPQAAPQIAELAAVLQGNPRLRVVIVGHTDTVGGFDYNLNLSQRRAQSVLEALAGQHGIARARLTASGAGMTAPVATNRTEEGRARNRRVEIVEIVAP
ncbi:MAG: OmpA family protein [Pararhodobacter sp.]